MTKQLNIECNCPLCAKTPMKDDAVYKCMKTGSYIGKSGPGQSSPTPEQMKKIKIGFIDNEKNN